MNYIVLYEPEKPANVGNIIRTCMAFNARLIVVGYTTFDLSDKALKRAGMDYLVGFPIIKYDNFDEFYKSHSEHMFYVTRYSNKVYSEFNLKQEGDCYFLFGRESTGLPHALLKEHFEETMRIPMVAEARSLNLSNSVSIVLSEALRQQGYVGLSKKEVIKGENFLFEENIDNKND